MRKNDKDKRSNKRERRKEIKRNVDKDREDKSHKFI
jgi:hypothetical protein